jgi:hypothetical protein
MKQNAQTAVPAEPTQHKCGLICRSCGCRHFYVRNTIPLSNGKIRRYRVCRNCGRTIPTIEAVVTTDRS